MKHLRSVRLLGLKGLNNFGAGWYVLTANGKRVEPVHTTGGGYSYGGW